MKIKNKTTIIISCVLVAVVLSLVVPSFFEAPAHMIVVVDNSEKNYIEQSNTLHDTTVYETFYVFKRKMSIGKYKTITNFTKSDDTCYAIAKQDNEFILLKYTGKDAAEEISTLPFSPFQMVFCQNKLILEKRDYGDSFNQPTSDIYSFDLTSGKLSVLIFGKIGPAGLFSDSDSCIISLFEKTESGIAEICLTYDGINLAKNNFYETTDHAVICGYVDKQILLKKPDNNSYLYSFDTASSRISTTSAWPDEETGLNEYSGAFCLNNGETVLLSLDRWNAPERYYLINLTADCAKRIKNPLTYWLFSGCIFHAVAVY